ncbi:glycosyltransferase family 8 protein [Pseudocercospora fijiensis CIRAD86]|uniref:Glycosyltransferase family 8 protein n=1 Tax=Pseudocercospora fijiensis (strain CIRAD86) TaxID=383855 RepID=N1QAL4_PSEFD|nr:glycosyltransferase family 8 protein [Pseudocercospora fijiensis CIRAD86]EME88017.1 glycosyltransferase family 8 protein [Pseudocercospora fijiensis CIRAD86]
MSHRSSRRRWNCAYLALTVITLVALVAVIPLPKDYRAPRDAFIHDVTEHIAIRPTANLDASQIAKPASKHAYATFLASSAGERDDENISEDKYFVATRILAYQTLFNSIIHAPETRTRNEIPFIVLVNEGVSEAKRERLRRDGAIIWEADPVDPKWIKTEVSTWQAVLTKLRLWELTQFERICFLDGDTVLTRNIDDVFEDPAVSTMQTGTKGSAIREDEAQQPRQYVFAGVPEMMTVHHYPPSQDAHDYPNFNYLNAGFFVFEPSMELLAYYISLTDTPGRFEPELPEQNLLNYAHRRNGNMPWIQLDTKWNMHYPTVQDLEGGVATLHEKWWEPMYADLRPYLESWRWRMEGFYEGRDLTMTKRD